MEDKQYWETEDYFYWRKGNFNKLSKNFTSSEFECKGDDTGNVQKIAKSLVTKLQSLRDELGYSIKITSGYRSPEYQQKLKEDGLQTAKTTSQHELGNAVDMTCKNIKELTELSKKHFKAIGIAKNFIHVDLRSDKERTWSYS